MARTTFPAGQGGHWGMVQWGPQPGARPRSQALGTRPPAVGAGVASGFGTWESPAVRIHCGRLDGHSWGPLDSHSWGPLDSHSWGPWTVTVGDPWTVTVGDPWTVTAGDPWTVTTGDPWTVTAGDPWTVTVGDPWTVTAGDPWTVTAGAPGWPQLGPLDSHSWGPLDGHSWPWRNLRPGASRGRGQLGAGWLQACCCQCPYERTILATRPLAGGHCPVIQRLAGQ